MIVSVVNRYIGIFAGSPISVYQVLNEASINRFAGEVFSLLMCLWLLFMGNRKGELARVWALQVSTTLSCFYTTLEYLLLISFPPSIQVASQQSKASQSKISVSESKRR